MKNLSLILTSHIFSWAKAIFNVKTTMLDRF